MIKTEEFTIKNKKFIRTYSDKNLRIEREGERYDEAEDLAYLGYVYTETDEPIYYAD